MTIAFFPTQSFIPFQSSPFFGREYNTCLPRTKICYTDKNADRCHPCMKNENKGPGGFFKKAFQNAQDALAGLNKKKDPNSYIPSFEELLDEKNIPPPLDEFRPKPKWEFPDDGLTIDEVTGKAESVKEIRDWSKYVEEDMKKRRSNNKTVDGQEAAKARDPAAETDFWKKAAGEITSGLDIASGVKMPSMTEMIGKEEANAQKLYSDSQQQSSAWAEWNKVIEKKEHNPFINQESDHEAGESTTQRDPRKETDFWRNAAKEITGQGGNQ